MTNTEGWGNNWPTVSVAPAIAPPHVLEQLTLEKLPHDKDSLLMLWQRWQRKLAIIKESEMELRKLCAPLLIAALPAEERKDSGVNNVPLGNGYIAKVTLKTNYKLDKPNDVIEDIQYQIEKCGNEGKFLADRLITWTAKLSVSEYKELKEQAESGMPEAKKIYQLMNTIVVTDDGAPTIEIKEPKVSKK